MSRFNILSLDGGGYFGLYTISVLTALEEIAGEPLASRFDLIAGTSVGGIIALGIAAGVPCAKIKACFESRGARIFPAKHSPHSRAAAMRSLMQGMFGPKYQSRELKAAVDDLIGNKRIGELNTRVLVPVVNLTKGQPQIFKTPHHEKFRMDLHLFLSDVAIAAGAAPTYFPLASIGDSLYADGGVYANSPELIALHEAEFYLQVPIKDIHILSIGTTSALFSFAHAEGTQFGLVHWARDQRLIRAMISSQQHIAAVIATQRLEGRYLKIDLGQSSEQQKHLAFDVATEAAQHTLRGMANATIQAHINNPLLHEYLAHRAPKPIFYHKLNN